MKREVMVRKIIICLLAIGWGGLTAYGQTVDSVDVNLKTAIEIALAESPSVKVADQDIQKKKYYRKEQIAALLPNVSAVAGYNRTIQRQEMVMNVGGETNRIRVGTNNSWSGGLSLAMPLVAPTLWKTVDLSEIDIMLALENSRSSRISLVSEVKKAYYTLLLAKESFNVLNASYNNSLMNAQYVTNKFNQGLVSEFDKLRADVEVQNKKPTVITAKNAVELATMQLKVLMGTDVSAKFRFLGNIVDYEQGMTADLGDALDTDSFSHNSLLRQLDLQTSQLKKTGEIIRSTNLPTLQLSGNYQWNSMNNDFRIGNYQWTPYSVVGLTLNIPIFEGRAKSLRNKQNQIDVDKMRWEREDLVRNLEMGVQNYMNRINSAIEEVGANRENIVQAEKAYQISRRRFDVGSSTLLELNDSELALLEARLQYTQSIYNYLAARTELEQTVGREVENSALHNGFNE